MILALMLIIVVIAGLLLLAAVRPANFHLERSVTIQAVPDEIFPLINDLHRFNEWNPFAKKDPAMKTTYRGPAAGQGAAFDFDGNKHVGKGSIEIIEASAPSQITMKLDMSAPMECHNIALFTLDSYDGVTTVTWAMQGPSPFIARLFGLFCNMDRMVGREFESGLADLKQRVERMDATSPALIFQ